MIKNEMIWDLSQLVTSTDPTSIQKKLKSMVTEAERFRDQYHGKILDLDSKGLLLFLEMKDVFTLKYEGLTKYCRLKYSI